MIRYEVAYGDEKTPPCQPSHAEDATIKEKNRAFDDRDAPGVDIHVGERYLRSG